MARYDGPPGQLLDLIPASPNGVDLEWIHPYTYRRPYRSNPSHAYKYAQNNPLLVIDPSGQIGIIGIGIVGAGLAAAALACAGGAGVFDRNAFPGESDDFKHCVISCRIARNCSLVVQEIAALGKEAIDLAQGDPLRDIIDDLLSNQLCTGSVTTLIPIVSLLNRFRQSCECCCRSHGL